MKKIFIIVLLLILVLLAGCTSTTPTSNKRAQTYQNNITFRKTIQLMNYDEQAVSNSDVTGEIIVKKYRGTSSRGVENNGYVIVGQKNFIAKTDLEGNLIFDEQINIKETKTIYVDKYNYIIYNKDNVFDINIKTNGYYDKKIESIQFSDKIFLVNQDNHDYYSKDFVENKKNDNIKNNIDLFLEKILIDGYISNSLLEIHSIELEVFKEKEYITLSLDNLITYNSIKLNKYDIGKKVYDEIIRKMLDNFKILLENDLTNGVSVKVFTYTKNFTDDKEEKEKLEYKFIMPKEDIIKYKNMDITGQELLNNSYILMSGERIELKLQ